MQRHESNLSPMLRTMLRFTQIVALLELGYCIATLVGDTASKADWLFVLYTTWFALVLLSAEAILHRIRAGVYTLVAATLAVTIGEFHAGVATVGGASLALLVTFMIIGYILPEWKRFD